MFVVLFAAYPGGTFCVRVYPIYPQHTRCTGSVFLNTERRRASMSTAWSVFPKGCITGSLSSPHQSTQPHYSMDIGRFTHHQNPGARPLATTRSTFARRALRSRPAAGTLCSHPQRWKKKSSPRRVLRGPTAGTLSFNATNPSKLARGSRRKNVFSRCEVGRLHCSEGARAWSFGAGSNPTFKLFKGDATTTGRVVL